MRGGIHFHRADQINGVPARRKPGGACDYISGMTDKYAVEQFGELFIPKSWSVK